MKLFKKKETFADLEQYQETIELETIDELMEKEIEDDTTQEIPQIIETYPIAFEDEMEEMPLENDFDFFVEKEEPGKQKKLNLPRLLMNIGFGIILLLGIFVTIDVVMVSKFHAGPIFAVQVKKYDDGGTKEYLGIGYKVIKYHQIVGRRDMEIGTWKLTYSTTPVDINDLDFSIQYVLRPEEMGKTYHNKFVRLTSTVKEVSKADNTVTLEYSDEGGKYNTTFICEMNRKADYTKVFDKGDSVSVIGTMREFRVNPNSIRLTDCFAEEMIEINEE